MNIRGVSLKNRIGNLLMAIGEFFCRQGKKLHSAERARYYREAQEVMAEAERNAVPSNALEFSEEDQKRLEEVAFQDRLRNADFDWSQPVCDPTVGPRPMGKRTEEFLDGIDFEKSNDPGPEGPPELPEDFDVGGVIEPGDVPRFGGVVDLEETNPALFHGLNPAFGDSKEAPLLPRKEMGKAD